MKWSIVCPIHNEEEYLPVVLPSIYALKPTEAIFLIDSCTDNSARLCARAALMNDKVKTKIHFYDKSNGQGGYNERLAYLFREGYEIADTPYLMDTAGDILLSPAIGSNLHSLGFFRLISFGFYERNLQGIARLVYHAAKGTHYGGIIAFDKEAYRETEDLDDLRKGTLREDRHLIKAISSKYPTKHIPTLSVHLRPRPHNWGRYFRFDKEII